MSRQTAAVLLPQGQEKPSSGEDMAEDVVEDMVEDMVEDDEQEKGRNRQKRSSDDDNDEGEAAEDGDGQDGLCKEQQRHPTPLQLDLVRKLIHLWSNPDELIMDPFSGIGTVGTVCKELSRRYLGIELSKAYFDASICHV
jgi:DNA modification methylase